MAVNNIPGDTFSELFIKALNKSISMQVLLGILLSHLTSNFGEIYKPPGLITGIVMTMLGLMFLGFDIHYWLRPTVNSFNFLRTYPIFLITIGMWVGGFIWPQRML